MISNSSHCDRVAREEWWPGREIKFDRSSIMASNNKCLTLPRNGDDIAESVIFFGGSSSYDREVIIGFYNH